PSQASRVASATAVSTWCSRSERDSSISSPSARSAGLPSIRSSMTTAVSAPSTAAESSPTAARPARAFSRARRCTKTSGRSAGRGVSSRVIDSSSNGTPIWVSSSRRRGDAEARNNAAIPDPCDKYRGSVAYRSGGRKHPARRLVALSELETNDLVFAQRQGALLCHTAGDHLHLVGATVEHQGNRSRAMGLFVDQHLVVVLVAAHDQRMRPAVAQVVRHVEDRTWHHLLRCYRRLDADLGLDGAVQ